MEKGNESFLDQNDDNSVHHNQTISSFNDSISEENEDKTDNRLCNLNLMTPKENTNWGTCIQRRNYTRTKNNKGCKPISQFTQDGEYIRTYSSMSEIVRLNGGCRANIYYCCKGITKTAYGFIWRYAA